MVAYQVVEKFVEAWMNDGLSCLASGEVALGDIGFLLGAVHQDAVPRLILGRPRPRDLLVPFVAEAEAEIDVYDYTSVPESLVGHDLTDHEFWWVGHRRSSSGQRSFGAFVPQIGILAQSWKSERTLAS